VLDGSWWYGGCVTYCEWNRDWLDIYFVHGNYVSEFGIGGASDGEGLEVEEAEAGEGDGRVTVDMSRRQPSSSCLKSKYDQRNDYAILVQPDEGEAF